MRRSLGTRLVVLSIICVVVSVALSEVMLRKISRNILFDQISSSQATNLQLSVEQIRREIAHVDNTATVIATDSKVRKSLGNYSSVGVNSRLNLIASVYPNLNYIMLLDDESSVFAISTVNAAGEKIASENILGEDVKNHPFYNVTNGIVSAGDYAGIDPYIDLFGISKKFSRWSVAPVVIGGVNQGWVVLSYRFEYEISQLLMSMFSRLEDQDYPVLESSLVSAGEVVAGFGGELNLSDGGYVQSIDKQLVFDLGAVEYELRIRYDRDKSLAPLRFYEMTVLSIALSLCSILSLMLYWMINKNIAGPVRGLQEGAARFLEGDFSHRIFEVGHDELSNLAKVLNVMAANVSEARDNLEQKVAYRTSQAEDAATQLQLVVDSAADAIITTSASGDIISFSKSAVSMFLYQADKIVGINIRNILTKDVNDEGLSSTNADNPEGHEINALTKAGRPFPVFVTVVASHSLAGDIRIVTIRDITLSKEAERALIAAKDSAESSARYKSEFLASMSHEIRTPMNGVIGILDLLLRDQLNRDQRRKADLAISSARSLLTIINDILDFSKIEAGKLDVEVVEFNFLDLMENIAKTSALKAQEKGLELILDIVEIKNKIVLGDPTRLRQVLNNLLGNAIKFTADGQVVISVRVVVMVGDELQLQCSIEDTGVGISEEKQKFIFQSFTQVDASTTRHYGGTGLGLAIVKQLCELMGGGVKVVSKEGEGSLFSFTIALLAAKAVQGIDEALYFKGNSLPISRENIRSSESYSYVVLVVEANASCATALQRQLLLEGCDVVLVSSAEQAMEALCPGNSDVLDKVFDLALISLTMAGFSGENLARNIRQQTQLQSLCLIALTTMVYEGDIEHFLNLGFTGHFHKPLSRADLRAALDLRAESDTPVGVTALDNVKDPQGLLPVRPESGSKATPDAAEDASMEGARVLLVEDNKINQVVAEGLLESMGLLVDIAENGVEALNRLASDDTGELYRLILMDCQMPEMDGYEATRNIRDHGGGEVYSAIHIIAMTANAMKGDREKCLAAGMNDYLSKPIDPDQLEEKLNHYLLATATNA